MSDFTVFDVAFAPEVKQRVIVNTDAKNEADDQYAIVHAVLTPSFDLHGIIPAHYGTGKSATSQQESHDETIKLFLTQMRIVISFSSSDSPLLRISVLDNE